MKKINFNIKNRNTLYIMLCIVISLILTLTVVYAALSTTLNINGQAEITAASWDIYLNNPIVTNGSATTDIPVITNSKTATFSTTLSKPGDFYEFTVDVVNSGTIDAMIENVIKTPNLTTEQAKYIKYEITYQNGESITTKQLLAKETTMPIKVRIEYRRDISVSDLPKSATVLNLSLILEYTQNDGSSSSVMDNGVYIPYKTGRKVCFDSNECFFILYEAGDNVIMLAENNISLTPTPKQIESLQTTQFSNDTQKGENYNTYEGSIVEDYVNKYNNYLSSIGIVTNETRIINRNDLTNAGCGNSSCGEELEWIYTFSYWGSNKGGTEYVLIVLNRAVFGLNPYNTNVSIRPVINISKSLVDLYL